MANWVASNYALLNLIISAGLLVVWITYLQVFLSSYRQQWRPKILINRGGGFGLKGRCLISNMSSEAIYIESIVANLVRGDDRISSAVTDLEDIQDEVMKSDPKRSTRQGPLPSGGYMDSGSFGDLVDRLLRQNSESHGSLLDRLPEEAALEVVVIANYGSEKQIVGAKRRFDLVKRDSEIQLRPHEIDTEQIKSARERREMAEMLRDYL